MGRKDKYSAEVKIASIKDYLSGKKGVHEILHELSINKQSFNSWVAKYKIHGDETFFYTHKNYCYLSELKQ